MRHGSRKVVGHVGSRHVRSGGVRAEWTGAGQDAWLLRAAGPGEAGAPGDRQDIEDGAGSRVAMIVLGMHRSGTSAMARVLSLLGCALPVTLMPARGGNEAGHWESEAICAFNDEALGSAGLGWNDWGAVRAEWYQAPTYADWVARGQALVRQEFGGAGLFVMKDPRQCRLAPFWMQVLAGEQVAARVVLTLRHPWEVACSLARRDGMGAARAHLLWLAHMLEAERASRGCVRVVCRYDRLMACGDRGALAALAGDLGARLGVVWPRVAPGVFDEMAAFLDPQARHHHGARGGDQAVRALEGWAGRVHGVLARWAAGGEETARDHAELDAIAGAMAAAGDDLTRLVEDGERDLGVMRARVGAVEAELGAVREEADQALARVQARVLAGEQELGRSAVRLAVLEGALAESGAAAAMQGSVLAEREAGLADLADLRDALVAERVGLIGEIERLGESVAERDGALGARDEALARGVRRRVRVAAALAGLRARREDLAARLVEAEGWVWRLAGERRALQQQVAMGERCLGEARREIERGALRERRLAEVAPVVVERVVVEQVVSPEARGEIARLSARLIEVERAGEVLREDLAREQARGQAGTQVARAREEALRGEIDALRAGSERDLAERYGEIAALTGMLREAVEAAQRCDGEMAWLREVWAAARRVPWWARWSVPGWLAGFVPVWLAVWLGREGWLRRRKVFDARAYLAAYPDVAASGRDALDHYIAHGMGEGRMRTSGGLGA